MNFRTVVVFVCALFAWLVLPGGSACAGDAVYSWANVPFGGGGYVPGFVYHPKQPNILYARTDVGGMYRYDFKTKAWIPLLDSLGHDDGDLNGVLSIALDPNDPDKVYAACGMYLGQWSRKGAILRSNDQGRTWQKAELPIHVGGNSDGRGAGERLAVDPENSKILYYSSDEDGLWKSTDGGASFNKVPSPVTAFSLVSFDPKTDDIYLGSVDGQGSLYVSHDDGQSFRLVDGTPSQVPQHMAFGKDGKIYVAYSETKDNKTLNPANAENGSVWKRDVAGHWSDVTPEKPTKDWHFGYSGIDVGPEGTVAVSTLDRWVGGDDIYISRDAGAHWIGLKDKSHHDTAPWPWLTEFTGGHEQMGNWISDVKINPFNKDEMIYVGPWMSRNLSDVGTGKSVEWDYRTKELEETVTLQLVVPMTGNIKVMGGMGDNAGAAWYDTTKPPFAALFRPGRTNDPSVDYASARPDVLVRTSEAGPPNGFYSVDGGRNWKGFPTQPYTSAKDWHDRHSVGTIAVSALGTSIVWAPEKENASYSTDLGKTWHPCAGWPKSGLSRQLKVISDKAADGAFYVFDEVGTIHMSIDGGVNFQPVVDGLPKIETWQHASLAIVPGRLRDLWMTGPFGLLHSPDSTSAMTKLRSVTEAWSVGFGAPLVKGGYPAIYLAGKVKKEEGIWRSDDEGETWVRINDDAHRFGGDMLISGDMREPGVVYIAPGAHGIKIGRPGK